MMLLRKDTLIIRRLAWLIMAFKLKGQLIPNRPAGFLVIGAVCFC